MEEKETIVEVVNEEKVNEPQTETVLAEEVIEEPTGKKEKKVIDGSFFNKLGDKIKAKIEKTKHNIRVATKINHQFNENASRYILLDTAVKGLTKILLEKNEENKTFTFLGKLNLKPNALLKDSEGNLFKIVNLVEGEHTRKFTIEDEGNTEEYEKELTIYSYITI